MGLWDIFIYLEHNGCCPSQVSTEVEKVQVLSPKNRHAFIYLPCSWSLGAFQAGTLNFPGPQSC